MSSCLGSAIHPLALQIEEQSAGDAGVFVLHGEFDAYLSPLLEQQLEAAIERGVYDLVVDMCDVQFADMSTLNAIVRAMKAAYRHNGHLVVACADRHILRAIELAGLRHAVRTYETHEQALASLRARSRA